MTYSRNNNDLTEITKVQKYKRNKYSYDIVVSDQLIDENDPQQGYQFTKQNVILQSSNDYEITTTFFLSY